jgi:AcrR family transcriptional regulator
MSRTGRPRVLSRATLEEAASELFLEQGYLHTSIDDIAARAGISRATFFNYFDQKSDLLYVAVDDALDRLEQVLEEGKSLKEGLGIVAAGIDRAGLPLVVTQVDAMGAQEDVKSSAPSRLLRLKSIIRTRIDDPVWQWAIAGAITEGALAWALAAPGGENLPQAIDHALARLDADPSDYFTSAVD